MEGSCWPHLRQRLYSAGERPAGAVDFLRCTVFFGSAVCEILQKSPQFLTVIHIQLIKSQRWLKNRDRKSDFGFLSREFFTSHLYFFGEWLSATDEQKFTPVTEPIAELFLGCSLFFPRVILVSKVLYVGELDGFVRWQCDFFFFALLMLILISFCMMSLYFHVLLFIKLRYFCMAWDIYDALMFLLVQCVAIKFILHNPFTGFSF